MLVYTGVLGEDVALKASHVYLTSWTMLFLYSPVPLMDEVCF